MISIIISELLHNVDDSGVTRFRRLQSIFSEKMTELYLLFYSHVLHGFVRLNLFLQREEPIIGVVYEQVIRRYKHTML